MFDATTFLEGLYADGNTKQLAACKGELLSAVTFQTPPDDAPTGTDSHDAAQIVYLCNDDLDRRVLDALDNGRTIKVSAGDFAQAKPAPGVPDGWTGESWARRLRQLADACEPYHPDMAAEYRRQSMNLLENNNGLDRP